MIAPLALVAAMHQELAAVLELLPDERKTVVAGREFWRGHLHGHEVIAVLCRIGKVAAATTATALIEHFGVREIVFTGVAGGLGPGVRVGDVVVADAFLQHDLDASPIFPRHEVPLYGRSRFATDAALTERLLAAARQALPEALAVEMEGAAVAQVCHDYGVPFAAVRTISDRADDAAHTDFQRFIRDVASRYSLAILSQWLTCRHPA